jgi:uncharacterized protein (TIGR03435 family)
MARRLEPADAHVSPTAHGFSQRFGGVLREGQYINRDATMLKLIEAAYGVSEDNIVGGPGWVSSDLFDVVARDLAQHRSHAGRRTALR